jgi:hypothetical protein
VIGSECPTKWLGRNIVKIELVKVQFPAEFLLKLEQNTVGFLGSKKELVAGDLAKTRQYRDVIGTNRM